MYGGEKKVEGRGQSLDDVVYWGQRQSTIMVRVTLCLWAKYIEYSLGASEPESIMIQPLSGY